MSRSFGNTIADSLELGLGYAERLLTGIPSDRFARHASPGGHAVESNHPAFVLGHLSLYSSKIVTDLGGAAEPTAGFEELFSKDATCVDDPDGTTYPAMEAIKAPFFDGYRDTISALRDAADETFQAANPAGGRMAELFPTVGSAHAFYVGGHFMMHMGQLSAWRRMIGLGSA